ncbi:hypothetical protein [Streptomyces hydrogenans]|uniref:hypothetical protein n=1 Tax=Streptomyces hydrogenans TaxID=1873719 RepID=UPI00382726F8
MTSKRKHWRDRLGTPTAIVLFRTVDQWRFALYFAEPQGVADGYLTHPGADGEPAEAQVAARLKAEEFAGRPLTVSWQSSEKPDWWEGAITAHTEEHPATPAVD